MLIGGFQKFSLIDYPGKICAIVFTQGCNFRCPYCHNPELVNPKLFLPAIPENKIFSFLEKRKGKIDAVEITGGEPTLQPDLTQFIEKIKNIGYLIKLDTNGSNPRVAERLIKSGLIDYIAMDIKAPLEKYQIVTQSNVSINKIKESIKLIMHSGIDYEFRTTVVKSLLKIDDIINIGNEIKNADLYILQKFIPSKTLNPAFINEKTYSDSKFNFLKEKLEKIVKKCEIR